MHPRDLLGRPLRDLRLSVTDRCNFRCTYCMPRERFGPGHAFAPREELLSFEELTRLVGVFARLGVRKVRLTGGEPLLRRQLEVLVRELTAVPGIEEVTLTTNATLLAAHAARLRAAGLSRVNVSLDSLDPAVFSAMGDTAVPLAQVLAGIAAAVAAGLTPVKINTVLQRGVNDAGLLDLADYARETGCELRVIEYMDVGSTNGWREEQVVPSEEVLRRVGAAFPLEPVDAPPGAVARRYRYRDGKGELGVITSITDPFCGDCSRARVTAVGEFFSCLFAARGTDLRGLLRSGAGDEDLLAAVGGRWQRRDDRYSEQRRARDPHAVRGAEMSYLGG